MGRSGVDGVGVQDDDVCPRALGQRPAVAQTVELRRDLRELMDHLLEREDALLSHELAEASGWEVGAHHHVHVRTRVGGAEDNPRVAQHVDASSRRPLVTPCVRVADESDLELGGNGNVERGVEVADAALPRDVADLAPFEVAQARGRRAR